LETFEKEQKSDPLTSATSPLDCYQNKRRQGESRTEM